MDKQSVLILGGLGYVGSRLSQVLSAQSEKYEVDINDMCWYQHDANIDRRDYQKYTAKELEKYDVIVVLAGHSSVKSCEGPITSPWLNNVSNFVELLKKTSRRQLIIYASSASVYGNSVPGEKHIEESLNFLPINNYDVTKYALDQQATLANIQGRRVIGLRFGTVNGWSPNLRCDVMINAMYETVQRGESIQVFNKHISRAILGIEDLCRAIDTCISKPSLGIYNLASFNDTVENIAVKVAKKLNVKVEDHGNKGKAYDFSLDTTKFEQVYEFKFNETVESIIDSLNERYKESTIHHRNNYMIYNWEPNYGI